ncbi:MAG: hypothetical protein ACK4YQ_14960 [Phenylobacterium sp.]|uniref:hypothetical protein n=1 Tax=Phenylobacterium sp. TaxID=1871053 RepID=UPI00391C56F2
MRKIADQASDNTQPAAKRSQGRQALARRVREALLALGGEAHRQVVIEQVARTMGHDVRQIPEELEAAVISSFEENWRNEARRQAYGFHLRFGEGSHRWGVRPVDAVA